MFLNFFVRVASGYKEYILSVNLTIQGSRSLVLSLRVSLV